MQISILFRLARHKSGTDRPQGTTLRRKGLERAAGIEPASSVWKTEVLTITQRPRSASNIASGQDGQEDGCGYPFVVGFFHNTSEQVTIC